jgi:hypothetical protein
LLLLLLSLASCGEFRPQPATAVEPGGFADAVVSAINWRPLRSVVLAGPDGGRVPAYSLDVDASQIISRPPAVAIVQITSGWPRSATQLKAMVSIPLIRLL